MLSNISRTLDFIGYLFQSTDLHGIHSPFIYQLSEKVLYHKKEKRIESIEFQRSQMLVGQMDFYGMPLGKFVSHYSLPAKHGFLLKRLLQYLNITSISEYGKCTGIETNYLLHGRIFEDKITPEYSYYHPDENSVKIITNENWYKTHNLNSQDFSFSTQGEESKWNLHLIHLSDDPGFAWKTFDTIQSKLTNESVVVLTNIHYSDDHFVSWRQISSQSNVTVDIDLYRLGILFFRKEQPKESFLLRY